MDITPWRTLRTRPREQRRTASPGCSATRPHSYCHRPGNRRLPRGHTEGGNGVWLGLELHADLLKLDHFLVHDLPTHAPKRALVRSLALFSSEHGGRLVAEGVEDAATAEVLIELGVERGQGWHLGRPGPLTAHEERATSSGVDWPDGEDPATTALAVYDHDAAAPVDHAGRDVASAPARRPHRASHQGRDE